VRTGPALAGGASIWIKISTMTWGTAFWMVLAFIAGFAAGAVWCRAYGISEEQAKLDTEKMRREMDEREVRR
jgi:hypothetical protein